MKFSKTVLTAVVLLAMSVPVFATDTEEELTNKFLQRLESKHIQKLTWISGYFSFNRINRDNDYNKFAYNESQNFPTADVSWIGDAKSFGMEFGVIFKQKYAWSIGADYTLKMGEEISGSQYYIPSATVIENPTSEVRLSGIHTGLQYYFYNAPTLNEKLSKLALRTGFSTGFHHVKWDLWQSFSNLNLSTAIPDGTNSTFEDNAVSFSLHFGADYPMNFMGMDLGLDISYLYLNFNRVAWYNAQDDEIVASYTINEDGRVDLNFSGIRGKIELKRFFNW